MGKRAFPSKAHQIPVHKHEVVGGWVSHENWLAGQLVEPGDVVLHDVGGISAIATCGVPSFGGLIPPGFRGSMSRGTGQRVQVCAEGTDKIFARGKSR